MCLHVYAINASGNYYEKILMFLNENIHKNECDSKRNLKNLKIINKKISSRDFRDFKTLRL